MGDGGVPATEGTAMESCEDLTGLKKELCELKKRRKAEKAGAKAMHKSKVDETAKRAAKKAVRASVKTKKVEMKSAIKQKRGEIEEMRKNIRGGINETRQNRREMRKELEEQKSETEESGQALLQAYERKNPSRSRHKSETYKVFDVFQRGAPRRGNIISPRSRKDLRKDLDKNSRTRKAGTRLQKLPEETNMENGQ
jgi:hypothetical protein